MLESLRGEWIEIRQEKQKKMADLIRKAVDQQIHVVLLVQSESIKGFARGYLRQIGLKEGKFVAIELGLIKNITSARLCIPFEADCL